MTEPVAVVHVVAKTHLDLGFTALAAEVAQQYVDDFFPRAVAVGRQLRGRGGPEQLVWTTGSWILEHALATGTPEQRAAVAAAVADGLLAWHALPVTTHTELMDVDLVRTGLGISAELDARFGRTTTAAKMTDVPGHTRGLVPLLAEAGVTFLHLGVNPAWPVPEVPPTFRWRSPDGAEVVVAYQRGGYGGEVVVPGCAHVLAFLHTGDNLGPPSADDVVAAHAELGSRFPGAEVRASTLDAFARALAASGAVAALPVVTAEIGDPWLFGAGSDPQKLAAYRWLLRHRRRLPAAVPTADRVAVDRELLLVAEHTWGLDQKAALPDTERWDRAGLAELRATPEGRRFEASWAEQRAYVDGAAIAQVVEGSAPPLVDGRHRMGAGWEAVAPGEAITTAAWSLAVDGTGSLAHLVEVATGRVIAGVDHPLGRVSYQSFDEGDYERFYAGLEPTPEDDWWARWDNTKPGIDAAGATSATWHPELVGAWHHDHLGEGSRGLVACCTFAGVATERLGAPPELWTEWLWNDGPALAGGAVLHARLWWTAKPANRLPEALWWSFSPLVAEPERWTVDKLGQWVSPLDVVRHGGRSLHAVGDGGLRYDGRGGPLRLATDDAPLVAPGRPNLLDADPPLPDLAGGFHVLLLDNCWGTNFPMWNEGPACFRAQLSTAPPA
ncbi:DUF5054 domain-containing protein [Aquihabitans sp. G128]|uniref:DUF5054 domain-containing protein n=1 Tax=Aquihabitans sp. G128 TaxID=2849779 RepID=UPI001C24D745|nr:DUF5054 domain-containing protein [Aquihabitans sp. G128]QXC61518.1 DUF5054 domain-containing protein [Aquihabitans sp. G128]